MWTAITHNQLWNKMQLFQELPWDFLFTSRRDMPVLKDSLKHSKLLADQFASCTGRKELPDGNWIWAFAERPDTPKRWVEFWGLLFELSGKRTQQESCFGEKLVTSNTKNVLQLRWISWVSSWQIMSPSPRTLHDPKLTWEIGLQQLCLLFLYLGGKGVIQLSSSDQLLL